MITVKREDKEITRNPSFFKKVYPHTAVKQEADVVDEEQELVPQAPTKIQVVLPVAEHTPQRRYPVRNSRRPPEYLKDYA